MGSGSEQCPFASQTDAFRLSQTVWPDAHEGMHPPRPIDGSQTVPGAQSWSEAQALKHAPASSESMCAASGLGQNVPLGHPSLHQRAQNSNAEVGLPSPSGKKDPVVMEKQLFGCAPQICDPRSPMSQATPKDAATGSRGP
jgi:hypothetical protein